MSIFDSLAGAFLAPQLAAFQGEEVIVTPKGGQGVTVNAIVIREPLQPQGAMQKRVEWQVEVQVPMSSYPVASPNVNGDTIAVAVRKGDKNKTTKKVSSIVSQVGGMWHVRLD